MLNDTLLLLIIYSFLGWIVECLYCALISGEWVNRGFLYGPFCPVYGFGVLLVLWSLDYLSNNLLVIFIGSIIITSFLEYLTSLLLELMFHTKWWDYSNLPFNLHGRICLLNSILFGIGFVVVYYLINPFIINIINTFNYDYKLGFLSAFLIYFLCDFTLSIKSALHFVFKLKTLRNIRLRLLNQYKYLEDKLNLSQIETQINNKSDELILKFNKIKTNLNLYEKRIIHAFPNMTSTIYQKSLEELKKQHRRGK